MKTLADMNNKTRIAEKADAKVFMFFSVQDSLLFGCQKAMVEDHDGQRREIRFTAKSSDARASEYRWPDKELVWTGERSRVTFIGLEKPKTGVKPSIN